MSTAYKDENDVSTLIASSSTDGQTPVRLWANPITHRLLVDDNGGGGAGTVTSVAMTVPTGLTVSGSPITTAGTLDVELEAGYTIPRFIDNEIVSGTGTSWTLAQTPITGSEHIFANGQRLTPGAGNDYTISSNAITTANSYPTGTVLADYRY